ncbi:MAG: hypothetical protein PVG32_05590 [Anaerolineales bacterium]|jgi:hypothetical protein
MNEVNPFATHGGSNDLKAFAMKDQPNQVDHLLSIFYVNDLPYILHRLTLLIASKYLLLYKRKDGYLIAHLLAGITQHLFYQSLPQSYHTYLAMPIALGYNFV